MLPVTITGFGFSDLGARSLDIEIGTTWNYLDNLTIMRGRHTWKMGAEIRRIWLNNTGEGVPNATLATSHRSCPNTCPPALRGIPHCYAGAPQR